MYLKSVITSFSNMISFVASLVLLHNIVSQNIFCVAPAFSRQQTPTREHLFWDKVNQVSLEDAALTLGESALFLPRRTVPILGQGPNQFKN
jgi:hypothetical protein